MIHKKARNVRHGTNVPRRIPSHFAVGIPVERLSFKALVDGFMVNTGGLGVSNHIPNENDHPLDRREDHFNGKYAKDGDERCEHVAKPEADRLELRIQMRDQPKGVGRQFVE